MEVKQVYQILNDSVKEMTGITTVINEDLSNIIDAGTEIFNANAVDRYVKALVNTIGRMVFVDRKYKGRMPSVYRDAWEFGSVLEKIQAELPESQENESWELENGTSYDPNIFYKPIVSVKFFNSKTTFEINVSFTEKQVKQSFNNAQQMSSFFAMIMNGVENALTLRIDNLIMKTVNNFIAETIYNDYGSDSLSSKSGVRAVNLLYKYNQTVTNSITVDEAMTNADFIRFAIREIGLTSDNMATMSTIYNIGGKKRFTPKDRQSVAILAPFEKSAGVYLYDGNGQFRTDNIKLPKAETVAYWQGSGTSFDFDDVSKIDVKTSENNSVEASGILAVMYDFDALGVTNYDRRVTSNYNPKAEFYTNFNKVDASYFNDFNENFVVFFIA